MSNNSNSEAATHNVAAGSVDDSAATGASVARDALQRLDGRVAVVTGAGGGLGTAIVERLGALGASVVLLDLKPALLQPLAAQLDAAGVPNLALECDIADDTSVGAAAARVDERFGRCDILINNAGILPPPSSLLSMSLDIWDRTLAIDLRGVLLGTRHFGQRMLARQSGSIVNIASIAGSSANASPPYSIAKAGVLALTRHTAVEWGPQGVRTNSVSPGFIRTPLSEAHYSNQALLQTRVSMVPLRRLGATAEVAAAVCYLAGDGAGYINGQDLVVDGGFLETTLMHAQAPDDQYGGHR